MCGPANENLIDERSRSGPRSSSFLVLKFGAPLEMLSSDTSEVFEQISAVLGENCSLSTLAKALDIAKIGPSFQT